MFDVVGKHSIAAKANRYTTIKGLTEGQLGAEVVKGIIEQIQCVGHLQLHGLVIYTVGPTAALLENHALLRWARVLLNCKPETIFSYTIRNEVATSEKTIIQLMDYCRC